MTDPWHVPAGQTEAYLAGRVDQATASSVEAHVLVCAICRDALAERTATSDLDSSWARIEARIDARATSPTEHLGARIGVPSHVVRLLAPTTALRGRWVVAGMAAFLTAALLARSGFGVPGHVGRTVFLTIAPLIPLVAVASALGPASEPVAELARATPVSRLWIGALRAGTVLVVTIVVGLVASTIVPGPWRVAVAWLCPALALSGLGAALARRLSSSVAVGTVGAGWVGLVALSAIATHDRLAAFRTSPQLAYLAVAVVAVGLITASPPGLDAETPR